MADRGGRDGLVTACRGVRGATTVRAPGELDTAVGELLAAMLEQNSVELGDVAAVIFTLQDELGPLNPAASARRQGFSEVPLLMVREHGGDTRVEGCVRALMLVNSALAQSEIRHQYRRGAVSLRPDLVGGARSSA